MTDYMTIAEVAATRAQPDQVGRAAVFVFKDGDEFVTEWEGVELRASNPFGLDSCLASVGAPVPRSLYLVSRDDYASVTV
jgi:hypothetical protein